MLALAESIYYISNLLRFACEKAGHSTAKMPKMDRKQSPHHGGI